MAQPLLISSAMYFGDDPVVESYTRSDILLVNTHLPKSGNGPDAKCDAAFQGISSSNCSAVTNWRYQLMVSMKHGTKDCRVVQVGGYMNLRLDCGDSDM